MAQKQKGVADAVIKASIRYTIFQRGADPMPTDEEQVSADQKEVYTPPEIVWVGDAIELTGGPDGVFSEWPTTTGFKGGD